MITNVNVALKQMHNDMAYDGIIRIYAQNTCIYMCAVMICTTSRVSRSVWLGKCKPTSYMVIDTAIK